MCVFVGMRMIGVGYSENNIKYIFTCWQLAQVFVEKYNSNIDIIQNKLQEYENVITNIKENWLEENKQTIIETHIADYNTYESLRIKDFRKLCIISEVITNPTFEEIV